MLIQTIPFNLNGHTQDRRVRKASVGEVDVRQSDDKDESSLRTCVK